MSNFSATQIAASVGIKILDAMQSYKIDAKPACRLITAMAPYAAPDVAATTLLAIAFEQRGPEQVKAIAAFAEANLRLADCDSYQALRVSSAASASKIPEISKVGIENFLYIALTAQHKEPIFPIITHFVHDNINKDVNGQQKLQTVWRAVADREYRAADTEGRAQMLADTRQLNKNFDFPPAAAFLAENGQDSDAPSFKLSGEKRFSAPIVCITSVP